MPYFVYRINPGPTAIVKNLEAIGEFEQYREAKDFTKAQRIELAKDSKVQIKIIFADNQLHAEEQLSEARDEPVLREWEK